MPEKNQIYRARVEGYTSEGLGVARIDGQAVFVHRALRGEDCDVLILKVLKNAAFGKAVRVHAPSPHRVEPDCPYYGRCGGCDFRHMDRAEELDAKRQRVQDALRRIGGSAVTVEGIDGGEPLHYRNKSQYPVAADGSVGFYKARSHQVIPVETCLIQKPQADAAARALRTYIGTCGVSCYDERTRRGLVRHLYVRTNGAGQSLICVVVNGEKLPREETLVALLRQAVPEAIADAEENARRNGVENVEFLCGDAAAAAADLAARGLRPDVICVDPPRKGLAPEVVRAAAQMAPGRIVYVSCDPATLARDVKLFAQEGYEAVRAAAVDMFPGTANVESVVRLEPRKN